MMYVEIVHENGKRYLMPTSQVTVFADTGEPVALTYEHAGIILSSDLEHKDFVSNCEQLKIHRIKVGQESG